MKSAPGATRTLAPSSGGWCSIQLSYRGKNHQTVAKPPDLVITYIIHYSKILKQDPALFSYQYVSLSKKKVEYCEANFQLGVSQNQI